MICVVIGRTRHKMILAEIQEAARRGAQLLEIRLDYVGAAPDFKRLLENKPCAMVATVRRQEHGGRWVGTEDQRIVVIRQAVVSGFDWIDLETDIADNVKRFRDVKRIVSYHDMQGIPEDLEKIYERMCGQDADVVKVAVKANHPSDNLRVLDLLRNAPKPTIAICMGDLGFPSRLLGAKYGAPFTYAAFNKERRVAPGIFSFEEAVNIYDYDRINADTQVFGVVGDPVAHSLSPIIHNAAMRKMGFNGVYMPFRIPRGSLEDSLKSFERIPVQGYSVTIPHKEAAAAAATRKDQGVESAGAANTLLHDGEGLIACNTDYLAARQSLLAHLPPEFEGKPVDLSRWTALILGAGGVARAVALALRHEGVRIFIANRSIERAQKLAEATESKFILWEARHNAKCDLLVNCTSVGMHPHVDDSPIHASFFRPGLMVFDTVYTPETTLFVKEARARGCHVLTGVDMFVRQAALQFQMFTGLEPPLEIMREEVRHALSPLHWRGEI